MTPLSPTRNHEEPFLFGLLWAPFHFLLASQGGLKVALSSHLGKKMAPICTMVIGALVFAVGAIWFAWCVYPDEQAKSAARVQAELMILRPTCQQIKDFAAVPGFADPTEELVASMSAGTIMNIATDLHHMGQRWQSVAGDIEALVKKNLGRNELLYLPSADTAPLPNEHIFASEHAAAQLPAFRRATRTYQETKARIDDILQGCQLSITSRENQLADIGRSLIAKK
jgi:hypothetical protein